jgi:acyl-CoA thioester hydrolase
VNAPVNTSARRVRHPVRPAYGDTDQSGVIHHAVYLRWLEEARTAYLRDEGDVGFRALEAERVGFAVVRAELRYLKPARFDEELVVEVWVGKLGRAQLRFDYCIYRGEERLLEAELTLACIHLDHLRAMRLPDSVRARCEPLPDPQ